ncbi:NAD(P)-binding protein [Pluteus cervinus]|uniref:NAD(P)-binding protein n=1 Tax=Pluteus cervinus TaxID=181527 RepID=A0ACD3B6I1_9AGAR|nr:NAD(P)-binding protein [Pluteus cervinus]
MFWSNTTFDPAKDMNDLNGKVAIVTGSNTGIGYAVVNGLARGGAKVYMAARNEAKATDAIAALEANGVKPGSVVWLKLELSDLNEVKKAAEEFMSKETRLDILINNACLMIKTEDQQMINGVPDIMVTNHFGHFVFVQTLLPLLIKTTQEPDADVRIINVSSDAHHYIKEARFKTIEDLGLEWKPGFSAGMVRYGHTKLANVLFTNELQRRFDEDNTPIIAMSLHPGVVLTFAESLPFRAITEPIFRLFASTPDMAARTSLFAAASPIPREKLETFKAAYVVPTGQGGKKSKVAADPDLGKDLWELTEKVLKEHFSSE